MRKALVVPVPKGVFCIRKPNGKTYWYFQAGRGTPAAGKRIALPSDPESPAFWKAIEQASALVKALPARGTFRALVTAFKSPGNPDWDALAPNTQKDYSIYLTRIVDKWGALPVNQVKPPDILALRDSMSATPIAANHMLSVMKRLLQWAVLRGWLPDNPAREVPRFESSEPNKPWPDALYNAVLARAKDTATDIYRALYLLRETGQRQSDVLRFRPTDRHQNGFRFRIQKTSADHWVPLRQPAIDEIDGWECEPMQPFCMSGNDARFSTNSFGARWHRWLGKKDNADLVERIEREDVSLHGLRASFACALRIDGISHQEISSITGMSVQMVIRYTKKLDQEIAAQAAMGRVESLQRSRSEPKRLPHVLQTGLQAIEGKSNG